MLSWKFRHSPDRICRNDASRATSRRKLLYLSCLFGAQGRTFQLDIVALLCISIMLFSWHNLGSVPVNMCVFIKPIILCLGAMYRWGAYAAL